MIASQQEEHQGTNFHDFLHARKNFGFSINLTVIQLSSPSYIKSCSYLENTEGGRDVLTPQTELRHVGDLPSTPL